MHSRAPSPQFEESAQETTAALTLRPVLGHAGTARHLLGLSRAQPPAQHPRASPALGEGSKREQRRSLWLPRPPPPCLPLAQKDQGPEGVREQKQHPPLCRRCENPAPPCLHAAGSHWTTATLHSQDRSTEQERPRQAVTELRVEARSHGWQYLASTGGHRLSCEGGDCVLLRHDLPGARGPSQRRESLGNRAGMSWGVAEVPLLLDHPTHLPPGSHLMLSQPTEG